ncbi:hypothetical protein Rsub_13232, partial [Raphidocelis subcapitata]
MALAPVKVPAELRGVRPTVLEEYVRHRLLQFMTGLSLRLRALQPGAALELLDTAAAEALRALPPPDYGSVAIELLELQLVFRHDCLAPGCLEPQCALCAHSTDRRCTTNFDRKYLVNDRMLARCGAIIRIEAIDCATGAPHEGALPGVYLELAALDGNAYDTRYAEQAERGAAVLATDGDFDSISLLRNKRGTPLLMAMGGGSSDGAGRLVLQPSRGKVLLPDLQ